MARSRIDSSSALQALRRWILDPPVLAMVGILLLAGTWIIFSRVPDAPVRRSAAPPSPRTGFAAPDFSLEDLNGDTLTLSTFRGRPVVLNIWASWCLPCRLEMPAIERVYRRHQQDGLVVIGLNHTSQDSEAAARLFVEEFELTFPIVFDRDGLVAARYELSGLPSTYFIDRNGMVRHVIIGGPMSESVILANVQELLEGD